MAAPKGNQFWKLASKHGREKLFKTPVLLWKAATEYFTWCEANPLIEQDFRGKDAFEVHLNHPRPFTIQGICHYLNCNVGYFNDFENSIKAKKDKRSKDFSGIITHIKEIIYRQKYEHAATGFFNANIIARDLGLSEKIDANVTSESEDVAKFFPFAKPID